MTDKLVATFTLDTPIGPLLGAVEGVALCVLTFADRKDAGTKELLRRFGTRALPRAADPGGVVSRLSAYFKGDLEALERIEVDPAGSQFRQGVWTELRKVPAGTTVSYSELARRIGNPLAVRAVAGANANNPVPIVVPCHRVIAADGALHGYGGGLDKKRWLLVHERALLG